MDNLVLFICGIAVTLMSGMGILVYMVSVGYEENKKTLERKKTNEDRLKEKINADLGAATTPIVAANPDPESIVGIPSVS